MTKLKQALLNSLHDHFIDGGGFDIDEGNIEIERRDKGVTVSLHAADANGNTLPKVLERYAIVIIPRLVPGGWTA